MAPAGTEFGKKEHMRGDEEGALLPLLHFSEKFGKEALCILVHARRSEDVPKISGACAAFRRREDGRWIFSRREKPAAGNPYGTLRIRSYASPSELAEAETENAVHELIIRRMEKIRKIFPYEIRTEDTVHGRKTVFPVFGNEVSDVLPEFFRKDSSSYCCAAMTGLEDVLTGRRKRLFLSMNACILEADGNTVEIRRKKPHTTEKPFRTDPASMAALLQAWETDKMQAEALEQKERQADCLRRNGKRATI